MRIPRLTIWDRAAIVVSALQIAAGVYVLQHGSEGPVPMHFDNSGAVDRWGDRSEAALAIFGCALGVIVIHLVFGWAARTSLDRGSQRALALGRIVGLAAPAAVTLPMVYLGAGFAQDLPETAIVIGLMGAWVVVALAGVSLGKTTPNPWIGMRVYWTYKSRLAWDKSNRLLGRIYFFGGIAGLVLTPFGDMHSRIALVIAVVAGGAIVSLFEAWRTWRVDPDRVS